MKRAGRTFLALLAFATLGAAPARAEHFGLDQAVDYALHNNPDLKTAEQQVLAAGANTRASEGGRMPRVDLSYTARTSDNPLDAFADKLNSRTVVQEDFAPDRLNDPGFSNLHAASLVLTLPVYTGGRLDAEIRSAGHMEEAARLQYDRRHEQVSYQTIAAYRRAQGTARAVLIAEDAVAAARRHARTTRRLVQEGRIITSDQLTAEVYLAGVEGALEQARSQAELAVDQLKLVMGLPLDAAVTIDAWQEPGTAADDITLTELERRALDQRRDLRAARASLDAATARIDVARAADKPQVSLMASSNWFDDHPAVNNQSWSIAGVVNMNLYSGGVNRDRVAASSYEAEQQRSEVDSLERRIQVQVREAYRKREEAASRYAIARRNVNKARRSVALVNERYGQGRTILIDLLQAERALVETRREALESALGLQINEAALDFAIGRLARSDDR